MNIRYTFRRENGSTRDIVIDDSHKIYCLDFYATSWEKQIEVKRSVDIYSLIELCVSRNYTCVSSLENTYYIYKEKRYEKEID